MRPASLALVVLALAAALLAGCPRGANDPPPSDAPTCHTVADCNAGATCGLLHACVGTGGGATGNCEAGTSLEIACP